MSVVLTVCHLQWLMRFTIGIHFVFLIIFINAACVNITYIFHKRRLKCLVIMKANNDKYICFTGKKPYYYQKCSLVSPGSFYDDRVDWYNDTCFVHLGWLYSNVRLVHLNKMNDDCVYHDGYTDNDPIRWQILDEISL